MLSVASSITKELPANVFMTERRRELRGTFVPTSWREPATRQDFAMHARHLASHGCWTFSICASKRAGCVDVGMESQKFDSSGFGLQKKFRCGALHEHQVVWF